MEVLRILLVVSQGDFYCATSLRYKNENLALNERLHFISLKKSKSQDNTSIFDVEKSVKELARFNETSLSEKIQPTIKKNRNKKRFFYHPSDYPDFVSYLYSSLETKKRRRSFSFLFLHKM